MSEAIDNFHLLTSKQRRFILNNDELLIDLVKTNLSYERFKHTLGVADLASKLATYHHVDSHTAWLAGLFHDLAKELSEEEMNEYLKYYDKDKIDEPFKVKHSHVCKYYLKEKLHINNSDILNAVYNHTVIKSNDKLSMILYIADKRDVTREINDEVVDVAKKDLKKAIGILIQKWKDKHNYQDASK